LGMKREVNELPLARIIHEHSAELAPSSKRVLNVPRCELI
jgi:hypothetical protein